MEFAKYNEMTVVNTYIDRALSAKTDNRPEFQKMIKDSYKCNFDVVIVYNGNNKEETVSLEALENSSTLFSFHRSNNMMQSP